MRVLLLVSRSIWTLDRWRPLCRCIKMTLRRDFLNDHPRKNLVDIMQLR
nr:MAG TPA: hypothetical protein [Podoviridae sp. ctgHy19]